MRLISHVRQLIQVNLLSADSHASSECETRGSLVEHSLPDASCRPIASPSPIQHSISISSCRLIATHLPNYDGNKDPVDK